MDTSIIFLIFMSLAIISVLYFTSRSRGGRNVCTRCSGTGEVNEKWPDPKEPSGWHRVEGICPKCKGKGRVNTA